VDCRGLNLSVLKGASDREEQSRRVVEKRGLREMFVAKNWWTAEMRALTN